jgi:hypothetical protein
MIAFKGAINFKPPSFWTAVGILDTNVKEGLNLDTIGQSPQKCPVNLILFATLITSTFIDTK